MDDFIATLSERFSTTRLESETGFSTDCASQPSHPDPHAAASHMSPTVSAPITAPPSALLALPDALLALIAARLPSPDKKATRLACRLLRFAVDNAITSLLLTDTNLPYLAPPPSPPAASLLPPCPLQAQLSSPSSPRRARALLHLAFPNLTHLCLALSPAIACSRQQLLHSLLRHSLPALRGLRCLDLSLACRDVALGRTATELYDTWTLIVDGLPEERPVRLLLHPPAALPARGVGWSAAAAAAGPAAIGSERLIVGGRGSGGVSAVPESGPASADVSQDANVWLGHGAKAGSSGDGGGGGGDMPLLANLLSYLGARRPAAEVRFVTAPLASKRYDKPRIPSFAELMSTARATRPLDMGVITSCAGGGGGGRPQCTTSVRRVGHIVPPHSSPICPAITGLVLGPESFIPPGPAATSSCSSRHTHPTGAAVGVQASSEPTGGHGSTPLQPLLHSSAPPPPSGRAATTAPHAVDPVPAQPAALYALRPGPPRPLDAVDSGDGSSGGDDAGIPWLSPLLCPTRRPGAGRSPSSSLQCLTLWEAWPLESLLGSGGDRDLYCGGGGGVTPLGPPAQSLRAPACLWGLRQLVLSDQQAFLNRDRLSAAALAPLSCLPHLTRLELASLTVNATALAVNAKTGSGGDGGGGVRGRNNSGGSGRGVRERARASGGKGARAAEARGRVLDLPFIPLPQVRHLSVYHTLRVIGPREGFPPFAPTINMTTTTTNNNTAGSGRSSSASVRHPSYGRSGNSNAPAEGADSGESCGSGTGPLAWLFPRLAHLSASLSPGPPGRAASERWGYLEGLGPCLTSLHLRATAAEDLCLQGRSETLAALTRVTSLKLSADSGKIDGLRGLTRTLCCLPPRLTVLRLARLSTRSTDLRTCELVLPRLSRLVFSGCSADLLAAWDGVVLRAGGLRRLEIRECDTLRPGDLQWALERQMALNHLILKDCPGMESPASRAALRAARSTLPISVCPCDGGEVRILRRSRHAGAGALTAAEVAAAVAAEAEAGSDGVGGGLAFGFTADDLDEL